MKAEKRIGVAVAGCGQIARTRHIPEYEANPHTDIIGFFDADPTRAEEMARQHGGCVYPSFEALLADSRVEAVSICTPNWLHGSHTMQALRAGKDVLCEKPMASTVAEAEEMMYC